MGTQTAWRGSVLTVTRRFATGIDISEEAVRLAVVSKRLQASRPVCVERLEEVRLEPGVVVGGDFIDRAAISAALREAFSRLPARGALRSLRCAMALPASATLTTRVPLARLSQTSQVSLTAAGGRDPRGLLEPAVLAEAERVAGIERGALAAGSGRSANWRPASVFDTKRTPVLPISNRSAAARSSCAIRAPTTCASS